MKKDPAFSEDSQSLHEAITRAMDAYGRGALTLFAAECGMTPSGFLKRMKNPSTAFDGPTLRAVLLVMELRKQAQPLAQDGYTQAHNETEIETKHPEQDPNCSNSFGAPFPAVLLELIEGRKTASEQYPV